jgi:hypothetical protein
LTLTLHQARFRSQLLPPVIQRAERYVVLGAELASRLTAGRKLLQHFPHFGGTLARLAHAAIVAGIGALLNMACSDAYFLSGIVFAPSDVFNHAALGIVGQDR